MIVQWCIKGMHLDDEDHARGLVDGQRGLVCQWWRRVGTITPPEVRTRLTLEALDRHVNHFDEPDPATGLKPQEDSPFISLSAGVVDRDAARKTNTVIRARRTALWFGSGFGAYDEAYLFICWTLLSPRQAVGVEGVAEEIRDLNTYRRYSEYQTEGEVVAKVIVPANQIVSCERWVRTRSRESWHLDWHHPNRFATDPEVLSNVRQAI